MPSTSLYASGFRPAVSASTTLSGLLLVLLSSAPAVAADLTTLDLTHDSHDTAYRTPGGAVARGTAVKLRLRANENALASARLLVHDRRTDRDQVLPMTRLAVQSGKEWWEATLPTPADAATLLGYRFSVTATDGTPGFVETISAGIGGKSHVAGTPASGHLWPLGVYTPGSGPPSWLAGRVAYRVVLDRFRDGDPTNDRPAGTPYFDVTGGTIERSLGGFWNTPICQAIPSTACTTAGGNFYGGDLQGLSDNADYLQGLGISMVIVDPVFAASSFDGMDPTDLFSIDPRLGTVGKLDHLRTELEARGMKLVMEAGLQSLSADSPIFDRYRRHSATGACESATSPYRSWFRSVPGGPCAGDVAFESIAGDPRRPRLDFAAAAVRDYLWASGSSAVIPHWTTRVDGWLFRDADTMATDSRAWPQTDWWLALGAASRAVRPDVLIAGEATQTPLDAFLLEGTLDAGTMGVGTHLLGFWRDTDFVSGGDRARIEAILPTELDARLRTEGERVPPVSLASSLVPLSGPDGHRALTVLDGSGDIWADPNHDWSDAILRLHGATLLQMTLPGVPVVTYGDEVGLVGWTPLENGLWSAEPYGAPPFPWLDQSGTPFYAHLQTEYGRATTHDFFGSLGKARSAHPSLQTGAYRLLLADDAARLFAFARLLPDNSDAAIVVVNRGASVKNVSLSVAGLLPAGATLYEVLADPNYPSAHLVDASGTITLTGVPAMGGALLVSNSPLVRPPAAATDLRVASVGHQQVGLAWSASPGAERYKVFSSVVAGGGWQHLADTTGTSYAASAPNGELRHYTVVAEDLPTLLRSAPSNEVEAVAAPDLSAGSSLTYSSPLTLTRTLGQTGPTTVTALLWVNGLTGTAGPLAGARVQVGFGPSGSVPSASWTWTASSLTANGGASDTYSGSLQPETAGPYDFVARFSVDGGRTWIYAADKGRLTVFAGADTTPPTRPVGLRVAHFADGEVRLEWTANGEPDLAGYDLERAEAGSTSWSRVTRLAPSATSLLDAGLTVGAGYEYRLVAFDRSGNRSVASDVVSATAATPTVNLTFSVTAPVLTQGFVYLAGQHPALGNGVPDGLRLASTGAGTWQGTIQLRRGTELPWWVTRGSDQTEATTTGGVRLTQQLTVAGDAAGNQLASATVTRWRDPSVLAASPAPDSTDAATTGAVSVQFDRSMFSAGSFTVQGPNGAVAGTVTKVGTDAFRFQPASALAYQTWYDVSVSGAAVADGSFLQVPFSWRFRTEAPPPELCNGVDDDADPATPDGVGETWLGGPCDGSDADLCTDDRFACSGGARVCADVATPGTELCDGLDNDCDAGTADGAGELWLGEACDGEDADLCADDRFSCSGGARVCADVANLKAERCDGLDNDCDASTADGADEAWLGEACDGDDADLCADDQFICSGGAKVCGDLASAKTELCDGLDNDCDPMTADGEDELWIDGACDGEDADLCADDRFSCSGGAKICADVANLKAELCDALDNDCNPATPDGEEDPWLGEGCDGDDADLCADDTFICEGGARICGDLAGAKAELCDGLDNDCDPATPDGADEPEACDGDDADFCADDDFVCYGGFRICSDVPGSRTELCDGLDNDCDEGTPDGADEAWLGEACDGGDADLCAEGVRRCEGGRIVCSDATGDTAETCDGKDDDCDGQTDEDGICDEAQPEPPVPGADAATGCGCQASGAGSGWSAVVLGFAAFGLRRRRTWDTAALRPASGRGSNS